MDTVKDKLLSSEITAPLDSTAADVVHSHLHGACPSARRLHLHGACLSARRLHLHGACLCAKRPRFAMCEATLHGHTALCVSSNFQNDQLPQRRGVSKETWRALISPLEMTNFHTKTDDVHLASRSARRRRSFPSPSTGKFSSLPSITISVTSCRIHAQLEITDYAQTRRRRTTRPRVPVDKTSRRRPTKAQRAVFIDSQERPPSVAVSQTYKEIGNLQMQPRTYKSRFLAVTPKVTSYYSDKNLA